MLFLKSAPKIDEMKVFIKILIVSHYNQMPSKRNYWETEKDMHNQMVYEARRRDRFLKISRFFHFASNNVIGKMYKLRLLTD